MFVLKVCFWASTRGPHTQLTALWAGGRFLPLWASSPAWQRRLDVIKAYTPSAIRGCVKWALLLPNVLTISVCLHHSCEISQKKRRAYSSDVQSCVFILWFHLPCLSFFFFFSFYVPFKCPSCVTWRLVGESHHNQEDSLSRHIQAVWKKASEKYDHSCKMDQLFPIDNLQSPLLLADSAK